MATRKPGPYAPLSAYYADDEKIMAAGEDAELLYVRMLAYAARTPRAEGWISDGVIQSRLGILPRVSGNGSGNETGTDAGSRAGKLAEVGLISRDGGGYRINSWLRWNKSVEEMERDKANDRKRKGGPDLHVSGNGTGKSTGNATASSPDSSDQKQKQKHKQKHNSENVPEDFDRFLTAYGKRTGINQAKHAYLEALEHATPEQLEAAAKHHADYHRRQGTEPRFIPGPAKWLTEQRWLNPESQPPPREIPEWMRYA